MSKALFSLSIKFTSYYIGYLNTCIEY
jgi:hypothetical protein